MTRDYIDGNKTYRQMIYKEDPRTFLQMPEEVFEDLKKMAEHNKRSLKAEILARLIASLTHNDVMMVQDRLYQLIFNAKLAVDK